MSSTTIRYSGVPENSHSRGSSNSTAADFSNDVASYTSPAEAAAAPPAFVPGFSPGKAAPVSDDPRHNPAFPHPSNPGLFAEPDGFYDWADRRSYHADGSPDPMTPGAYRYQTRPDLCDLDAPDSSPSSPRYETDALAPQARR